MLENVQCRRPGSRASPRSAPTLPYKEATWSLFTTCCRHGKQLFLIRRFLGPNYPYISGVNCVKHLVILWCELLLMSDPRVLQ